MFWRKKNQTAGNMDEIGREVARAAGLSDDEVKAASSRIHYAGIRARILAEKDRGAQSGDGWLLMMLAVRRAIPAMAVIAALAAGVLWFAGVGAPGVNSFHEAISGSRGTCALPARDECLMTTDEVLAAIVSQEQEGQR